MRDGRKALLLTLALLGVSGMILYSATKTDFTPKLAGSAGPMQECGTISLTVVGGTTSIESQNNCFPAETSFSSGQTYDPCYLIPGCVEAGNSTAVGSP